MDGDRDSNNLVVHSEPDNEDNEEFSSPLGSPNLIDTQTVLYTNQGTPEAIIGLSNAQATGISTNEGNICVSDNTSILEVTDIFKSKGDQRKRVKFNSDNAHFDDTDLWAHDPNENSQDMINAYQKECMVMKIKPIQILLDQLKGVYDLNTPIDTIDLTGVKLENRACEVLEAVLSRVHASTLKLERTNLEDEGIIAICEMVEFYGCACKLLLAHNNRLRPRAWLTIGRTLKKSPFVSTIDVSYCALDEQTLTLLLRAVRANCGLKVLKMEGNNLTGKGTFILMAAMKFNENLQELHLSRNHLGPEDGQHLGNILRTNHTLRVLDVSDNNLQDPGIRYISAGIAEQQEGLFTLNVSTNNLTHEGIHHISAMLPCSKSLRELNISNNRFGDNGLFMLKLGILANRSVEKLSLSCTRITCEGAIALAEVLAESRYLVHVDLRENEIRIAGLMALSLAMRMNHKILHLETPKTFKVEQRDRQLIKELLSEMEKYRARNHKEKEEQVREEIKRIHEATHKKLAGELSPEATLPIGTGNFTADEEEKEVDPSLIGSLDNVYTEETEAALMNQDDPFKKVDMPSVATPAEMEKTVNELVIYSSDVEDRETNENSLDDRTLSSVIQQEGLDLLTSSGPHRPPSSSSGGSQELLPDIISNPNPMIDSVNQLPPDIAPHGTLPPDLAPLSPLDLLNPDDTNQTSRSDGGNPLDLTKGIPTSSN